MCRYTVVDSIYLFLTPHFSQHLFLLFFLIVLLFYFTAYQLRDSPVWAPNEVEMSPNNVAYVTKFAALYNSLISEVLTCYYDKQNTANGSGISRRGCQKELTRLFHDACSNFYDASDL